MDNIKEKRVDWIISEDDKRVSIDYKTKPKPIIKNWYTEKVSMFVRNIFCGFCNNDSFTIRLIDFGYNTNSVRIEYKCTYCGALKLYNESDFH
jgi:hypothetical protein